MSGRERKANLEERRIALMAEIEADSSRVKARTTKAKDIRDLLRWRASQVKGLGSFPTLTTLSSYDPEFAAKGRMEGANVCWSDRTLRTAVILSPEGELYTATKTWAAGDTVTVRSTIHSLDGNGNRRYGSRALKRLVGILETGGLIN